MISIKKYLDAPGTRQPPMADPLELLPAALECYRALLQTVGECASRAYPATGAPLLSGMSQLRDSLCSVPASALLQECEVTAEANLRQWSQGTAEHLQQAARQVRELLLVLAKAGEDACQRDQRHAARFLEITQQLNSIASLEDIAQIRGAVMRTAHALKTSTRKMTEEGQESLGSLKQQISVYQTKLEEAEMAASRDGLTGLRNRQSLEEQISRLIEQQNPFCLMMIDLNGFKAVNDSHGHATGDELLKQFATELRSVSRSTDVVGRWGGDEFVILVDGTLAEGEARVQRIRDWACGEYTLKSAGGELKIKVGAAIGLIEAAAGEPLADAMKRADAAMYADKRDAKSKL
jgi:diguanylate cyclase (GGDEF)-like protein